jgi:hypothetical protein
MQIVEINLKDFKDTLVLMLEHPLGTPADGNKHIDTRYICDMMARDWGFYYTFTTNLRRVPDYIAEFPAITAEEGDVIRSRVGELLEIIEAAPKSMRWKIRAKIGTRTLWYQEVTEKSAQF